MGSELPAILTHDDHARGCQGREYACTCGYDDRVATTLSAQEEQIERLTKALTEIMESEQTYVGVPYGKPPRDLPPAKIARAALEGSKRDG